MLSSRYVALCLALFPLMSHTAPLALQKGMSYVSARKILLKDDWKMLNVHAQDAHVPMGVEHELIRKNYREFDSCSIDNSSCVMRYKRGNECLSVFTIGEKIKYMKVVDWSDECAEQTPAVPMPVAK